MSINSGRVLAAAGFTFVVGILDGLAIAGTPMNAFGNSITLAANIIALGLVATAASDGERMRIAGALVAIVGLCLWGWTVVQAG